MPMSTGSYRQDVMLEIKILHSGTTKNIAISENISLHKKVKIIWHHEFG